MGREVVVGGNMQVDGRSQLIQLDTFSIPVPKVVTEEHTGAGGVAAVEIPLGKVEVMIVQFTLVGLATDVQKELSVLPSASTPVTLYGQVETETGEQRNVRASCRGLMKMVDQIEIGNGLTKTTYELSCHYYKYEANGVKLHEIDAHNGVLIIGGKDQYPGRKEALGL